MTARTAERITGLEIREVPGLVSNHGKRFPARTWAAFDGGHEIARMTLAEHLVVKGLVDAIYRLRSERVRREQNYRCFCCGLLLPLEIDHIIPRGTIHGRDDRRTNLRALAVACHRKRHDPLRPKTPTIHPSIAALMEGAGFRWGGEDIGWLAL